jgi:hypothetical protein
MLLAGTELFVSMLKMKVFSTVFLLKIHSYVIFGIEMLGVMVIDIFGKMAVALAVDVPLHLLLLLLLRQMIVASFMFIFDPDK